MALFLFLQNRWIGLLHHVCNDHEWTGGQCTHGSLSADDQHPHGLTVVIKTSQLSKKWFLSLLFLTV